ncbi:MAG: hypothetical protein F6J89_02135 [Symploca sp. SIO1C4]|uniref:Uncharacterized protein n=1 Tax=Symploca sp. SIO1C4 TaxID=2607765 RepID=A0A6B3N4I5_9CYAN|nr:hypothetical protein [Symploca sp. SIO1C4]
MVNTNQPIIRLEAPLTGDTATRTQLAIFRTPGEQLWVKVNNNQPHCGIVTAQFNQQVTKAVNPKHPDGTPQRHPEDGNKVWQLTGKSYHNGNSYYQRLAAEGDQIFVIPNLAVNGIRAKDITECRFCFVESDDGTIDEQWQKLVNFVNQTGLTPRLVVFSGGKSLHIYWELLGGTSTEDWQKLQRKLILIFHSDPQIANPNREMRLAGVQRGDKQVTIEFTSPHKYSAQALESKLDQLGIFPHGLSYERWTLARRAFYGKGKIDNRSLQQREAQLREVLSKPEPELFPPPQHFPTIHNPIYVSGGAVPLEACLGGYQELVSGGAAQGTRNNTGFTLACNLIAIENTLQSLGENYTGNAQQLFEQYCQNCSPALDSIEAQRIWQSASYTAKGQLFNRETLSKRIHWYRWQNDAEYKKLSIAAWKQELPFKSGAPEPDPKLYQEYLQNESELAAADEAEQLATKELEQERQKELKTLWEHNWDTEQLFNNLKQFLGHLSHKVQKQFKGFGNHKKLPKPDLPPTLYLNSLSDLTDSKVYRNQGCPKLYYKPGELEKVLKAARFWELGYKGVLVNSGTGSGKSHTIGQQQRRDWFRLEDKTNKVPTNSRLFYACESGENTTVKSLENWTPLARMHNGLVERHLKLTGAGKPFIERPKPGETPTIPGNCHLTAHRQLLGEKNLSVYQGSSSSKEGDTNYICDNCPHGSKATENSPNKCSSAVGEGFGFKAEMKDSLAAPRIKGTLTGFPGDHNLRIVAFIDEVSQTLKPTKDLEINLVDLEKEFLRLWRTDKELYSLLEPIYGVLNTRLTEHPQPKYGYDLMTIKGWFAEHHFEGEDFDELILRLDQVTKKASLAELEKVNVNATVGEAKQILSLNWLKEFCQVLAGYPGAGSCRIVDYKLIVTIPNHRHLDFINSCEFSVFLDATGDRKELAKILRWEEHEILLIEEMPQPGVGDNLRVVQVTGLGGCGKIRSQTLTERINAVEEGIFNWAYGEPTTDTLNSLLGTPDEIFQGAFDPHKYNYIRHKDCIPEGIEKQLYYFGGSAGERGSNAASDCQVLVLEGLPNENIGGTLAQYHTIYHTDCSADDPHFQAWYNQRVLTGIYQGIGRSRYRRRPEETIPVFILGESPHQNIALGLQEQYGLLVQQIDAGLIEPAAADREKQAFLRIVKAIKSLVESGKTNPTQQQVAAVAGVNQSNVSRTLKKLGGIEAILKLCAALNKDYLSATHKLKSQREWLEYCRSKHPPSKDPTVFESLIWIGKVFLPMRLLEAQTTKVIEEIGDYIQKFGHWGTEIILGSLPESAAITLLTEFLRLLSPQQLAQLRKMSLVPE